MTDPISDMLTRIRNAQMVGKLSVFVPNSRIKKAIAEVLRNEGYIEGFQIDPSVGKGKFPQINIQLKYHANRPVIEKLDRISRPSLRHYVGWEELPRPFNGLGIAIISTSKGIMSDRYARTAKLGGEVLCIVY